MISAGRNIVARRWLTVVAMLGVLVHAYALVRHNASMLTRSLAPGTAASQTIEDARQQWTAAGLPAAAFLLCLSGDPLSPASNRSGTDCPLCHGAPAAAVPPPQIALVALPEQSTAVAVPRDERTDRHLVIRPPARGPPALA